MSRSLKDMFEERRGARDFRKRNQDYLAHQAVYDSQDMGSAGDNAYRPNLQDGVPGGAAEDDASKIVVNQVRRVVNHFTATFAYPPRVSVLPLVDDKGSHFMGAEDLTSYVEHVFTRSGLSVLHPRNAHWLSLRGDCVFGIDWGLLGDWGVMSNLRRGVRVFTFDPMHCYPLMSPFDPGGVEDMLVGLAVSPEWAKEAFSLDSSQISSNDPCRLFYYWTRDEFRMAVEDVELEKYSSEHKLGFCPFRWVYGDAAGRMGQADVREIPKLQQTFNEGLLLAIDAVRKQVDASWWFTGAQGGEPVEPQPGQATPLPDGAQVGRWEIAADPQIILGLMDYLERSIQATTGVSPISMQGAIDRSNVTGTAVRHQVEAAEHRAETRKALFQDGYGRLAEMILHVTRSQFPEGIIHFRAGSELRKMTADQIAQLVEADAEYGGFLGLPVDHRVQIALQGLGRLWDDRYAVASVLDLPGTTPDAMVERVKRYQLEQARAQGEAQQLLQQGAQGGQDGAQSGSGGPGGPQQGGAAPDPSAARSRPQRPPQPSMGQLRAVLAQQGNGNGRH